jgi:hypothetical protein
MSDERFAMYQGHVVESVLENIEKQIASGGRVEVKSSLSGLRSNVIEARDKEFNKHADKRKPVGKRVDTVSKRVEPKKGPFGYMRDDTGKIVPINPYPPEPAGVPFEYGSGTHQFPSPQDVTPEGLITRSQELKNQHLITAAIHSDPIANATEVSEDVVRAVKSTSTSISTKARLAEDTLNAIEVVQSNRLGYAAVAAGAGALVLGLGARNRKNSKKQL